MDDLITCLSFSAHPAHPDPTCGCTPPLLPPLHFPPATGGSANLSLVNTTYMCVPKQAVLPSGDTTPADAAGLEGTAIDGAAFGPPSTAASSGDL
jgi:hypothetical protein